MGVSTNAYLCFGVILDEDQGEFVDSLTDEECILYGGEYELESHQSIIEGWICDNSEYSAINYCNCSYPMLILAFKDTIKTALRGDPTVISFDNMSKYLLVADDLIHFCKTHKIKTIGEPDWYLASYWGR